MRVLVNQYKTTIYMLFLCCLFVRWSVIIIHKNSLGLYSTHFLEIFVAIFGIKTNL